MQSKCESNFKFLYSGANLDCSSCHQVKGSKKSLLMLMLKSWRMRYSGKGWIKLVPPHSLLLLPGAGNLAWVGVCLACTFLCCGVTSAHSALGAAWAKHAELPLLPCWGGRLRLQHRAPSSAPCQPFPPGFNQALVWGLLRWIPAEEEQEWLRLVSPNWWVSSLTWESAWGYHKL